MALSIKGKISFNILSKYLQGLAFLQVNIIANVSFNVVSEITDSDTIFSTIICDRNANFYKKTKKFEYSQLLKTTFLLLPEQKCN